MRASVIDLIAALLSVGVAWRALIDARRLAASHRRDDGGPPGRG